MKFVEVARWLISEFKLTIEDIGKLTDHQIELLYLPEKKKSNVIHPFVLYRQVLLKRGLNEEEIMERWKKKRADQKKMNQSKRTTTKRRR